MTLQDRYGESSKIDRSCMRRETKMTPEGIVAKWVERKSATTEDIRAYGEQCASQALAEQKASKPLEPTKLEMVARAIYEKRVVWLLVCKTGRVPGWAELPAEQIDREIDGARAAIEALKPVTQKMVDDCNRGNSGPQGTVMLGITAMLDSILSEVK